MQSQVVNGKAVFSDCQKRVPACDCSTSDTEAAEQLTRLAESEVIRWEEELASADSRDSRDSRDADVQG